MKSYRILVHDNRLGAIELSVEMRSDGRVREFARERFGSSEHVRAVEVWSGPDRICALGEPPRAAA
jgi:hypothetical protein